MFKASTFICTYAGIATFSILGTTSAASMSSEDFAQTAPYGSWISAISAEAVGAGRISLSDLRNHDGALYWTESSPQAAGKVAVYKISLQGEATQLTPVGSNVRTRVHEYGGAPFAVVAGTLYYSEFIDQRLYRLQPGGLPLAVTPAGYRYADCVHYASSRASESLLCVREDHTDAAHVRNAIVRLPLPADGAGEVLFAESDFVAYPRVSRNGAQIAFIAWDHPRMPWDGTELKVATLGPQGLHDVTSIAGGPTESVLEPQWDDDGTLYFISDRSGFWNLYAWKAGKTRAVCPRAAEFAAPLWSLGQANYVLLGDGRAAVAFTQNGVDHLGVLNLKRGELRVLDLPYASFSQLAPIDSHHVAAIAGAATAPRAIVRIDLNTSQSTVVRRAGAAPDSDMVSVATPIDFPSANGRIAHAFYFAPHNPKFRPLAGTLPPLLTLVHGGPTAQAEPIYSATIQFWTSRGFAVADVNYGGSSGYGRDYRRELNGAWGVVDVEDVVAAARYLSAQGYVDPQRMAITGGSAGGFTVLAALSRSDVFHAGADYYGVSDMTALAKDTHKFESRYLDSLIGPLPQAHAVYEERSPLNHLEGFKVPVIVFQGAEDPVVPPNQSEKIVDALRARKVPYAYLLYLGEGHGFRDPKNVINSLQAELVFYGHVFGFSPAGPLPALTIQNFSP